MSDGYTWAALMHTPGPAAAAEIPLQQQPQFMEHVAFLQRMFEHGFLVAAGPLLDADGDGMTVLRLPGQDGMDEINRLATEDDQSVRSGFMAVTVRPWRVAMDRFED